MATKDLFLKNRPLPFVVGIALVAASAFAAMAEPVELRMGAGPSSEEQVWLMKARPDLTPDQGKIYKYAMSIFRSGNEKTVGLQAGQLDAITASSTGALFAASKGVPLLVPVSHGEGKPKTFSTSYLALTGSDVSLTNLKGKTIGINGYRASIELYARIAVAKAGLDPTATSNGLSCRCRRWMKHCARGRSIIGAFPSTFAFVALKSGGFRRVFDSAGISGIEEEFDIAFNSDFVSKNRAAVQAWVADFAAVTRYSNEKPEEARKSLIGFEDRAGGSGNLHAHDREGRSVADPEASSRTSRCSSNFRKSLSRPSSWKARSTSARSSTLRSVPK